MGAQTTKPPNNLIDIRDRLRKAELLRERARREARKSLFAFIQYCDKTFRPTWFHKLVCDYVQRWAEGSIKRLMILMPPRHGKSTIVSKYLPAWILGRDASRQIIATSYAATLASKMNASVQQIMNSPQYAEVFPDVVISSGPRCPNTAGVANQTEFDVLQVETQDVANTLVPRGTYICAGTEGSITGMGGTDIIIDDPVKNATEAMSEVSQESVEDWYRSTLYTRLEKDGKILLTMTPWSPGDLRGRLLEEAEKEVNADQWVVLRLPLIADDDLNAEDPREVGEMLWPWKYPIERLPAIKVATGRHYNALMQCRPDKQGGNIVKRAWFNFWTKTGDTNLLPDRFDEVLTSWDLTFKSRKQSKTGKPDFVVGLVLGRKDGDIYVLDMVREQMSYLDTKTTIQDTLRIWPQAEIHLIEDKANGPAIQSELEDEFDFEMIEPEGDKAERLSMAAEDIRGGKIYLPMPHLHEWVRDLIDEVTGFPNAKNDDIMDALTQAILYWREKPFDVLEALNEMMG